MARTHGRVGGGAERAAACGAPAVWRGPTCSLGSVRWSLSSGKCSGSCTAGWVRPPGCPNSRGVGASCRKLLHAVQSSARGQPGAAGRRGGVQVAARRVWVWGDARWHTSVGRVEPAQLILQLQQRVVEPRGFLEHPELGSEGRRCCRHNGWEAGGIGRDLGGLWSSRSNRIHRLLYATPRSAGLALLLPTWHARACKGGSPGAPRAPAGAFGIHKAINVPALRHAWCWQRCQQQASWPAARTPGAPGPTAGCLTCQLPALQQHQGHFTI
jgi:hypothetical protein